MYPKNAASPQRIAVGPVVQISDGAVQTSGVSVKVLPQGGTASAGGGTTGYEEGIVHYLPTQAETNYASFVVIAYKTGCIPATVTIVTTASSVAGYAGLDWATINAPTSTVGLTNTTVGVATTLTNLPSIPSNWLTAAGIAASALNGKGDWNVGKTGYALTATTGLGNQTADITGTVSTVTNLTNLPSIPANWLTAAGMDATASSEIAGQVWDEVLSGHAGVGSTGAALSAAGGSGDPWATALPGAYGAGTAGQIIGDMPTATENADALLNRDMSAVSDTNARSPLNALRFLRNKWSISGTTLTVTKENDSTSAWTSVVTAAPGADPISGNDPA